MQCKCKCTLQVLARSAYAKTLGKSDLDAFARTRTRARGGGSNVALARISLLHPPYSPCPGAREHTARVCGALRRLVCARCGEGSAFRPVSCRYPACAGGGRLAACSALCGAESVSSSTLSVSWRRFIRSCPGGALCGLVGVGQVCYFFYKNIAYALTLFWFGISNAFSAEVPYTRTRARAHTHTHTHTHAGLLRCSAHFLDSGGCMAVPVGHDCRCGDYALLRRLLRRCGDYCAVAEDLCTRMGEALRE